MSNLVVDHLEVRYGDLVGVADISLKVGAGKIVALLGSNGAGKTTTLNAIAGLVRPSSGRIEWQGEDISGQPAYVDRRQRPGAVAGGLAALCLADGRAEFAPRRHGARRIAGVSERCSIASTRCSRACANGGGSLPERCPAASVRCWRSAAP